MPPELPVPYPCNEHEAHVLMAIFVVTWGGMLAVLIVQAIREDEIGFMLALLRYLLWRRFPRRQRRR